MSEKETRRNFFESEQGAMLLGELENERKDDEKGIYAVSGQWAFENALESKAKQFPEIRKSHCDALRNAGYKENLDEMTDMELAEFIGGEGFEYLIDREEAELEKDRNPVNPAVEP